MLNHGPHVVRNYVFNDGTLTWDAMAQPSTAAGGAGSTQVVARPGDTSWASSAGFHFNSSGDLLTAGGGGAGSTQVSIADILTKASGTSVMDSTQNSIGVTIREGSAAGSTQVSISSGMVQAQPRSDSGVSLSTDATPASTRQGLVVRQVDYSTILTVSTGHVTVDTGSISVSNFSTQMAVSSVAGEVFVKPVAGSTFSVRPLQSSAADLQMTATPVAGSTWSVRPLQSSAADLQMTASPLAGSTWNCRALQSSAADLQMTASQNSTAWSVLSRLTTSSGGGLEGSTTQPAGTVLGLHVRPVFPALQSTGRSTTGNGSTRETFVSSAAGARVKVYAYSITSTAQAVNQVGWFSSNANLLWPIVMQSFSSGITGANLAVTPPAWLFATDAANALTFGITGTTGTYNVGVSWFTDT
jgi:hypothetical protein